MNTVSDGIAAPAIGTALAGGFYAGRIRTATLAYDLIVAPRALELAAKRWNTTLKAVTGAGSFFDGAANTRAMAEAGSRLAKSILALSHEGHDDWYLPARDELELLYRAFKPTGNTNWCWRGDNPSSELDRLHARGIIPMMVELIDEVLKLRAARVGLTKQHHRDSAELRRLCTARDEARRDRGVLKVGIDSVLHALARAGVSDVDDPGEAIGALAADAQRLRAAVARARDALTLCRVIGGDSDDYDEIIDAQHACEDALVTAALAQAKDAEAR